MSIIFWLALGGILGYNVGWVIAHKTVAAECKRLGGFFVDKETFKCTLIEPTSPAPSTGRTEQ